MPRWQGGSWRKTVVSHRFRYRNRRMVKKNKRIVRGGQYLFSQIGVMGLRFYDYEKPSRTGSLSLCRDASPGVPVRVPCSREIVARNCHCHRRRPDRYPERPTLKIVTPDELRPPVPEAPTPRVASVPSDLDTSRRLRLATARTVSTRRLPEWPEVVRAACLQPRGQDVRSFHTTREGSLQPFPRTNISSAREEFR
jgi:hypothetical protein